MLSSANADAHSALRRVASASGVVAGWGALAWTVICHDS
jgi:hypothetical protein